MGNNYQKNDKMLMRFSTYQLDRIIVMLINNGYNKKFASNTSQLFSIFNPTSYVNDYEKDVRVYMIMKLADSIQNNFNLNTKEQILAYTDFNGKYKDKCSDILDLNKDLEITDTEMDALDKQISDQLRYAKIENAAPELIELLTNLNTDNYDSLENEIIKISGSVDTINKDIKSARESIEDSKKDVDLSSGNFVNVLDKIITKQRNPADKVKTGIRMLNDMLDGGFEKGRCYCFLGVAKGWKSGCLLNICSWAKRYNTFVTKDPNKKPVIVYLTMENSIEETIGRFWNHCFGNESEMKNFDKATAANMLEKAGIFTPNNPSSPELQIWYRSNRSITTSDLNGLLDDLEKEGKECVFLVLDYLKRIRPVTPNKEIRLELGAVSDELTAMAKDRDIPIVTAMQLNREAFKTLEDANSFDEKVLASDKLGVSNVGESIDIIQNCDVSIIINKMQNRVQNNDGDVEYTDRYLFVKLIATRCKQPKIESFKHRFKDNNDMALMEDLNLPKSLSIETNTDFIRQRMKEHGQKTGGGRTIISDNK
jgi:replicative DNA helicase